MTHPIYQTSLPVISAHEMARIEALSIQEGASAQAYMDKAGEGVAAFTLNYLKEHSHLQDVILLIGKGNNGGDALCAGCYLLQAGMQVKAYCLYPEEASSDLNKFYRKKFLSNGGSLQQLESIDELIIEKHHVILDGIVGTGFDKEVKDLMKDVIETVNQKSHHILAIDIPSGLNGSSGKMLPIAIKACHTLYLELPKIGCFYLDGYEHAGKMQRVLFGLNPSYIQQVEPQAYLLEESEVKKLLPEIQRTRHKYQAGYVVALAGSKGMAGAALLTTLASMRAGAGIVRLFYPEAMNAEVGSSFKELIKAPLKDGDDEPLIKEMKRAKALLIGPGLQIDSNAERRITLLLHNKIPAVIDAGALEVFTKESAIEGKPLVLTPHKKEMLQCLHKEDSLVESELFSLCQAFCEKKKVTLVLKGAPTFIFYPDHKPLIMARGDPGMAKAGTGDVLTGIIAAYLAQGLAPLEAAILGTFIHGLCGEKASWDHSSYSVIASDLIDKIAEVYVEWLKTN